MHEVFIIRGNCLLKFRTEIRRCYDGVMMGLQTCGLKRKGVAKFILNESPHAAVTHCCSHNLNLSVASSWKEPIIDNVLETYRSITIFFNTSPKK